MQPMTRYLRKMWGLGLVATLAIASLIARAAPALEVEWDLLRPSNSGVPGEEIRRMTFAPDGDLWVAARWPFWGEGGIGVLDRENEAWSVWANWETPIPSEYINDVKFDPEGVAWIATDLGLVRLDGNDWTIFNPANSPMQLYRIADIAIAPNGHVWINNSDSNAGGDAIYDFDGVAGWTRYAVPDELPWEAPWTDLADVFVDRDGRPWVANKVLSGIAGFDGSQWTLYGDDVTRFESICEDNAGNLWMMGNPVGGDEAFFKFDGASFTRFGFASPTLITVDPEDGAIYVANWFGQILRSTNGGVSFPTWLSGLNRVYNLAFEPGGTDVWVGTIGAVGHFQHDGTWVGDDNSYNSGMPWFWVDRMTTDRDGYFWVATGEAGLSRFDGFRWRNWGAHNAGSEPYPFEGNEPMGTAYQDRDGTHWFGGNGIARWDSETGQFTGFWNWQNNPGMGVGLWTYFAEDAAGNLFATEEHGATYRFNENMQRWDLEPISPYAPPGLPGMESDEAGNVWIAAWFDIHRWNGSEWSMVELPYPDYFFDLGGITCMAIGPDGIFWFGTVEGLVRWDGLDFTLYDETTTPMPANGVRGLDVRPDGLIGIAAHDNLAAESGIAFIDGDPADPANWWVSRYGESPQPHWQLSRAAYDAQGRFWVSALSMGVAILDPDGAASTGPGTPETLTGLVLAETSPNPFRSRSSIRFTLPEASEVSLDLFDVQGRRVRALLDGRLPSGEHVLDVDGRDLTPGVYFYSLRAPVGTATGRMVVTR